MDLSPATVDDATEKQLNRRNTFQVEAILGKFRSYYCTMRFKILLIFFLVFSTAVSYAQFRKKKKKKALPPVEQTSEQPSALNPSLPTKEYAPRASRKSHQGPTYESEQRYYERMAALEKTKRKNEKMMDKPQYSDPMYFGHKHPPKKHKAGKLKYCKECGIRH